MTEVERRVCAYCGAPLRELVDGACPFCRTRPFTADGAPVAPPTSFSVVLLDAGSDKIHVIKALRELSDGVGDGLGLKEAKDLADGANPHTPPELVQGVDRVAAERWLDALGAVGARVEIRPIGVAPSAAPGYAPPAGTGTFAVYLVGCGKKKIAVIKEIRGITGLGLKEAKDIADAADRQPQLVAAGLEEQAARIAATKLSAAGATAELRPT